MALFCMKHFAGPLDVWYDCQKCLQEVPEVDVRVGEIPLCRQSILFKLTLQDFRIISHAFEKVLEKNKYK